MERPKILAYYFPDWHKDNRNATWFGENWDEWELLKAARPRFEGHRQPRVPLDGPFDESTPENAERQIQLAKEHGVDGFLVDYYWYDDGPYLQRALDEGLLKAENSGDVEFALMWANHDFVDIFPHDDPGNSRPSRLKDGAINRAAFEEMVRHVVANYFSRPNYLTVAGRPWFTMYDIDSFIAGIGGVDEAVDALEWFDEAARTAGLPGVHLNAIIRSTEFLPTGVSADASASLIQKLGFRSATSYVWVHHADLDTFQFPVASIEALRESAFRDYDKFASQLDIPFYPNVTVGWDASPRTRQDRDFERGGYPWMPVWDPTPAQFEDGLREALSFVNRTQPSAPVVTVNAWNEWTEGSALLPDTHNGARFLEAVRRVFGTSHGGGTD